MPSGGSGTTTAPMPERRATRSSGAVMVEARSAGITQSWLLMGGA